MHGLKWIDLQKDCIHKRRNCSMLYSVRSVHASSLRAVVVNEKKRACTDFNKINHQCKESLSSCLHNRNYLRGCILYGGAAVVKQVAGL
ncbi:hypothetical protein T08_12703 [Trichinella sp. T8]|nr:hypothetical protein T08_12703 [Trichinella sp. T8]